MPDLHRHSPWVVGFSGGKDSAATLIWALKENPSDTLAIFCDTGAGWSETSDYIREVERRLGVTVLTLRGEDTLESIVRQRGRWPAPHIRLCTKNMKYLVLQNWIRDYDYDNALVLFGQRREESEKRKKLDFYDPAPLGPGGSAVYRPVLDWSEARVFAYLEEHGVAPHPAYGLGATRVRGRCVKVANQHQ